MTIDGRNEKRCWSVMTHQVIHHSRNLEDAFLPASVPSRCSRLRECCRRAKAEVISNSSNKIHQTWCTNFSQFLYNLEKNCFTNGLMMSHWFEILALLLAADVLDVDVLLMTCSYVLTTKQLLSQNINPSKQVVLLTLKRHK